LARLASRLWGRRGLVGSALALPSSLTLPHPPFTSVRLYSGGHELWGAQCAPRGFVPSVTGPHQVSRSLSAMGGVESRICLLLERMQSLCFVESDLCSLFSTFAFSSFPIALVLLPRNGTVFGRGRSGVEMLPRWVETPTRIRIVWLLRPSLSDRRPAMPRAWCLRRKFGAPGRQAAQLSSFPASAIMRMSRHRDLQR